MNCEYTITFACYNQVEYTKNFINSLDPTEVNFSRIVAVDNGSSDGTREWLVNRGFGATILNGRNLGCGAAWSQRALAIQSEWTVVMNNDLVCAPGWLRGLLKTAQTSDLKIVSPAMIEGELNYDFPRLVDRLSIMKGYVRRGSAHAVCMLVHQSVWDEIGFFMPVPKLLGYEDVIFFQRAREARVPMGISANAWIHHFGQTTQKAMKIERSLSQREGLGDRNLFKQYLNQSWLDRKLTKLSARATVRAQASTELAQFNATVHGVVNSGHGGPEWK